MPSWLLKVFMGTLLFWIVEKTCTPKNAPSKSISEDQQKKCCSEPEDDLSESCNLNNWMFDDLQQFLSDFMYDNGIVAMTF